MTGGDRFAFRASENAVEAWATFRLPFEPKGERRRFKNELRARLQSLAAHRNIALRAVYSSSEEGFFDVENVPFYNVGAGAFSHLPLNELAFELLVPCAVVSRTAASGSSLRVPSVAAG